MLPSLDDFTEHRALQVIEDRRTEPPQPPPSQPPAKSSSVQLGRATNPARGRVTVRRQRLTASRGPCEQQRARRRLLAATPRCRRELLGNLLDKHCVWPIGEAQAGARNSEFATRHHLVGWFVRSVGRRTREGDDSAAAAAAARCGIGGCEAACHAASRTAKMRRRHSVVAGVVFLPQYRISESSNFDFFFHYNFIRSSRGRSVPLQCTERGSWWNQSRTSLMPLRFVRVEYSRTVRPVAISRLAHARQNANTDNGIWSAVRLLETNALSWCE